MTIENTTSNAEKAEEVNYQFFSSTAPWYETVYDDISKAQESIYLESFRVGQDEVGARLSSELIAAHQRGVEIKVLLDWWGTGRSNFYVEQMQKAGIKVRLFKKFVFAMALFHKNHCRDHRKILVIDNKIAHIGSANYTQYCKAWRESVLRMEGDIAKTLSKIFLENYKIYNKDFSLLPTKKMNNKTIKHEDFFFIRELPSVFRQRIKKNYIHLIDKAKKSIVIESPYFLPGHLIYKALSNAAKRGVDVRIHIPQCSDIKTADYVRDAFLEQMHKNGIRILFFEPGNLHAKLLRVDENVFAISSANMDHRSFRYMFELAMIGSNKTIVDLIDRHLTETENHCVSFNKDIWLSRPFFKKMVAFIAMPFSHLL